MRAECARPIYPVPAREKFRALIVWNSRQAWMARFYRPRPGHEYFPVGYKERLATRGALAPEPEDD